MRSFKFWALVFLHVSLRGTDAAPTTTSTTTTTTTKAPRKGKAFDSNQYSWEWNEMDDDYKGDELEVEYEQPPRPAYRPTPPPTRPAYHPTAPPPIRPAYRPTAPPPTRPAYHP